MARICGCGAGRVKTFAIVLQSAERIRIDQAVPAIPDREQDLRDYAAGLVTWTELRERGFDDYIAVLGGLGELGLRPPIAPMSGPNLAARERGRQILRQALRDRG